MIGTTGAIAIIPVSNLERGIAFYTEKLGLELEERNESLPQNREARFKAGPTKFGIYESVGAGQSRHTLASFEVEDIDATAADLRARGLTFEEYDLPGLKTENGIADIGHEKAAWFKDPDGNILAIAQLARTPAAVS
jgi:catechol 2,3-dioxygenase-like lactoylglutathione lyase family enzyme